MATSNFLDQAGLGYLWAKITDAISTSASVTEKKIPSKVSQLENDKNYITLADVPDGVAASNTVPKVDSGSGSVGTEAAFARGDHVHPTDTTRLATNGDASSVTVTFTAPNKRETIVSGESFNTIAGKILKYMNDFGSCAFKSMILKEDLAPSVKTSLEKADTALQSYTETDPTVPAWAKTPTKPTYTAAEVGALSIDDANNNFAKKSDISTVYKWKGSKDTYDQLPTEGNSVGDIWNVKDTNMNYGWTEDGTWDPLGSPVEISPITNEAIDSIVAGT
jgi:hypothetical protein|nr:MAG TPA: hypothetical protein [Caudoviricetes sp.]